MFNICSFIWKFYSFWKWKEFPEKKNIFHIYATNINAKVIKQFKIHKSSRIYLEENAITQIFPYF